MSIKKVALALFSFALLNAQASPISHDLVSCGKAVAEQAVATLAHYKKQAFETVAQYKELAKDAMLPIAQHLTQYKEQILETALTYKKEFSIASGVVIAGSILYTVAKKQKIAKQNELSDKLITSKKGKKYLKLIKRIKKALECRIGSLVRNRQHLINYNGWLRSQIWKYQEKGNTGRWYQEMITKNNSTIELINGCLSELSSVIDIKIFAHNLTKAELLKAFAEYNCSGYHSIDDYESIKEDLKRNNTELEVVVNKLEQNLEQNRAKFSAVCAEIQKHINTLP